MMRFVAIALLLGSALTATTMVEAKVIGTMAPAAPITDARIATLPAGQRADWTAYLARSRALMAADKAALAAERGNGAYPPAPHPGKSGGSGMPMDRPAVWYGSAEARHVADNIVSFQTPAGGWGKNMDRSGALRLRGQHYVPIENLPANAREDIKTSDPSWAYVGTIDNNATTSELRFLARVQAQVPGSTGQPYRQAFLKGVHYLLEAQFPNGGWPQVYPLQGGYHDALTFNDDALALVANLLADVGARQGDYAFVPAAVAADARAADARAVAVILKTQVMVGGKRTVWGQQHDALTLAPAGARNFEPIALSSDESADLLMFLMKRPNPSPAMVDAVRDGIAWLNAHALYGVEWLRDENATGGRRLIAKDGAGPLWSRYYDIATGKPIFGDRDKTIHDDVSEISAERRNGYSWFNTGPAKAIAAYAKWPYAVRR
ncbi:MAG: pectate lyase [Sphingomonas sp.]|uniref:pectate lyase n=1 Tax=Sphingomonas sp. TaxID=28214 RepID=UPI003F818740